MGLRHVTVTPTGRGSSGQPYEADFLVDTGATDSLAPGAALKKMGRQPTGTMAYELADGTVRQDEFGLAQIEFMGEITAGRIILWAGQRRTSPGSNRPRIRRYYR